MSSMLGVSSPAFAADPTPSSSASPASPTRAEQVAAIQDQYNPLFDAEYARFVAVQKKALVDASLTRTVKAQFADFLNTRGIIATNLSSSTSDLSSVKDFAEEETGEFSSTLNMLEAEVAKIKTISCIKAKVVKKVTALSPKCPSGYKKK
jgi:hypothetical protein